MFVTVIVVLCHLMKIDENKASTINTLDCYEEFVTDSDRSPGLTFLDCLGYQPQSEIGKTLSNGYFIERYKCVQSRTYNLKGRA